VFVFSKIVFNIDGANIALHLHEVIQLAIDVIDNWPDNAPKIINALNLNKDIDGTHGYENLIALYEKRHEHLLFVPAHISGMTKLTHWLYAAKYCADKENQTLGKINAWWFLVAYRLLHLDLKERFLYVSDHGRLADIVPEVRNAALDLPWITNPGLALQILELKKEFDGYNMVLSAPLDGKLLKNIIYLELVDENLPTEYLRYHVLDLRGGSKNSDQNLQKLRYNSRQNHWRRDERTTQKIHTC